MIAISEQFLHPNKPLCRHNNPNQIGSNQNLSPGLMDQALPDDFPAPPVRRRERKTTKSHVYFRSGLKHTSGLDPEGDGVIIWQTF